MNQDIDVKIRSKIWHGTFSQVINRVGKIADLDINRVRVFKAGRTFHPSFLGVPTKKCVYILPRDS